MQLKQSLFLLYNINKKAGSVLGLKWTKKSKKKLSDSANKKAVVQFTKELKPIAVFESMTKAEEVTGINRGSIKWNSSGCRHAAGNYVWMLAEDVDMEKINESKNVPTYRYTV